MNDKEKEARRISYLLRNVSWPLWQKVKQEALNRDMSIRLLIINLLEEKYGEKDNRKDR